MSEGTKSVAYWQEKYRTLVREQAANDEYHEKQLNLLRHTLARVGAVARGTDESLDRLLESLKKELRHKGITRGLLQVIREIEQKVSGIEQAKSGQAEQWSHALTQIFDLLAAILPAGRVAAIEQLRADVLQGVSPAQLNQLLTRLQTLLVNAFADTEPSMCSPVTGGELSPPQPEQQYSVVGAAITAVIEDLIEHIKPPADAVDSVARVQRVIQQGLNWYELVPTLEELSLVVLSTVFSGQKDFERYLKQLFEQLAQMHNHIELAAQGNVIVRDEGQQFTQSVNDEIAELSRLVEQSGDLNTLKLAVNKGLESISGRLSSFTVADSGAYGELRDNLAALTDRVNSLQQEASTARELLQRQKQKALLDPLTKLPNRQAYDERSLLEFKRWQRYRRPLSLVVGDIDLFKGVNDTYGHLAGDKVLTVIAQLLSNRLRQTDFIARYGGEEIVFLMPETECDDALRTMDSVRQQIAECGFHFTEQPVQITMSFGVTELTQGDSLEDAFARADKALYQCKNNGRNQCVLLRG